MVYRSLAVIATVVALTLDLAIGAHAATITFQYDTDFGADAVAPDGVPPYATATFDDGGTPGSVTLTITVGAVGEADVTAIYFNVDPAMNQMDLDALVFTRASGTGPAAEETTISKAINDFMADGDGNYDILFDFPPPPGGGSAPFNANEGLVYTITGDGLTAASFNWLSTPGPGPGNAGPFASVAKFQSTGSSQANSAWVAGDDPGVPPAGGVVPEPMSLALVGSTLFGLIAIRRRLE